MKGVFANWIQYNTKIEKTANTLIEQEFADNGMKAQKIQSYGWQHVDVNKTESLVIGGINKRPSSLAFSGNTEFMFLVQLQQEATQGISAPEYQGAVRQIMFLQEFRKFGIHELNLSMDQAIGLINTDVNLDVDDFTSMYPLMIVNFPDELKDHYNKKGEMFPSLCFVRHDPEKGYLLLEFLQHPEHCDEVAHGCLTFFPKKLSKFETIQDKLDSQQIKEVMLKTSIDATKLAINSILLAQRNNAMIRLDKGPNHPLQQQFRRTMRGTGNFNLFPEATFWSFQPNLKTFNSESKNNNTISEIAKTLKPHWRKGHWRRVAHGTKRAERKWMHFPAVFVNSESFAGTMIDTGTSYNLNQPTLQPKNSTL